LAFLKKFKATLLVSSFLSSAISFPSSGRASKIESALSPVKVPISSTFLIFEIFIIK
jgi:hypothetical protein